MPERKRLILSCTAKKLARPATVLEMYQGPAWHVVRLAMVDDPSLEERLDLWALSAKYGLVPSGQVIEPYDQVMTEARALELAPVVTELLGRMEPMPTLIHAGRAYLVALGGAAGYHVTSGPPGRRLQQVKEWVRSW